MTAHADSSAPTKVLSIDHTFFAFSLIFFPFKIVGASFPFEIVGVCSERV